MAKKDFTEIAAARIYDELEDVTAQEEPKKRKDRREYSGQEAQEIRETMKTQGRKGAGLKRINLAFSDTNYQYISTMARVRGETLTGFVNHIVSENMARNAETYMQAIRFRNSL